MTWAHLKNLICRNWKEKLLAVGLDASPTTPQEFAARIKAESDRWEIVIKRAGIKLD